VFADADIEQAVNGAMMGIFFNQRSGVLTPARGFSCRRM